MMNELYLRLGELRADLEDIYEGARERDKSGYHKGYCEALDYVLSLIEDEYLGEEEA